MIKISNYNPNTFPNPNKKLNTNIDLFKQEDNHMWYEYE